MYILLVLLSFTLPLTLLIIGLIFYRYAPKKINHFSGYRTERSMKSIESWEEANKYSSKLMIKFSLPMLVITALGLILAGRSYDGVAIVVLTSTLLSIVFIIITIVLTEKHLKDMFGA